jgi:hypothetical protein
MVAAEVQGSSLVSVAELLGKNGARRMAELLERLPETVARLPEAHRADFEWTPAGERVWRTRINADEVRLDLGGTVAELTVSGKRMVREGTKTHLDPEIMARAEKRLNNLLALTVAVGVSQRLSGYVRQKAGAKVTNRIRVNAVQTVKNRMALRATTAIRSRTALRARAGA